LLVIETALRHGSAVAVTLGGGYAMHVLNTVTIHINTAKVAKEVLEKVGWRPS
jgi:acetoin utilization deacetylase AcuC-like enzyme